MPPGSRERRGRRIGAVALVILILATGCRATGDTEPSATVPAGTFSQTIAVDGRQRTFRLHRPARLAGPAALVVMLHGGFGTGRQAESRYGWNDLAEREGFVVVYPDGLDRAWNVGGGCCGRPASTGVDDVAFIRAMVSAVERDTAVDPHRVYATGMSNGGMLAYRLACETDIFAAVAPVAATLLGPCPSPEPVSVIHIHGTADRNVRYDGGPGDGVARIDGPAVRDVVAAWRATDRCAAPTVTTADGVTRSLSTCPDGRSVGLITVAGGGHEWPGPGSGLDPGATDTIWRFFAEHPRT